jgi:hypothetical protein
MGVQKRRCDNCVDGGTENYKYAEINTDAQKDTFIIWNIT